MDKLSIIVPVYNSENSLEELCCRIYKTCYIKNLKYEIILVDDYSVDNSYKQMKDIQKKYQNIKLIKLDNNYGQQNALLCGIRYASGDYVITLDDDLQYYPEDIVKLYKKIKKGYDVVYGIPIEKKHSTYRNLGTYLTDKLFNIVAKKPKQVKVSSYRIMNKNLVDKIVQDKTSFVYLSAMIFKHTFNVANIRVFHCKRKYGKSNYNPYKLLKLFIKLYIYYSNQQWTKVFRKNTLQYKVEEIS